MFGSAGTLLPEVELDPTGEVIELVGGGPLCQCPWFAS